MKRLICLLFNHDWRDVGGYYRIASFGTYCKRCGLVNETFAEFMSRTGREV